MKNKFKIYLSSFGIPLVLLLFITYSCDNEVQKINIEPTCIITSPIDGNEIQQGDTITISVNAADTDGNIEDVTFYIDNLLISSVFSFPYEYQWNTMNEELGNHIIKAIVTDELGSSSFHEISVTIINNKPEAIFICDTQIAFQWQAVNFTDQSINNPTSWAWNFGDGNTSTEQNPEHIYNEPGIYTISLTISNSYGTDVEIKSDYITVNLHETGTISDFEGNIYTTVKIGNQWWMAENLASTKLNDGELIPNVTSNSEWISISTPAYCWYNNDETSNKDTYGALYNSYVVETGKLCPIGWHVASDEDWKELEMYLGMSQTEADDENYRGTNEGDKLKAAWGWNSNGNGTNESGFSALPGGYRGDYAGNFYYIGKWGNWYTSTENTALSSLWIRDLEYDYSSVYRKFLNKNFGLSVRCIKD